MRDHNTANQITAIDGPTGAIQPAYDPAGNMTLMPRTSDWTAGDELIWDAWNRLTRIRPASSSSSSSSGSSSSTSSESSSSSEAHSSSGSYHCGSSSSSVPSGEVHYKYDARTRRIRKANSAGTIDYYYDKKWRAVEERVACSVTAEYVWSPLDRWTMIRRNRGSEEYYVLKDYLDPSAIINTSGIVIERFGYDAFGPVHFMDDDFEPLTASAAAWNFLFHAEFLDEDTGLYNYGYRYYNPQLGRWLSRDPIGIRGGLNLYSFVSNNPMIYPDFIGLIAFNNWECRKKCVKQFAENSERCLRKFADKASQSACIGTAGEIYRRCLARCLGNPPPPSAPNRGRPRPGGGRSGIIPSPLGGVDAAVSEAADQAREKIEGIQGRLDELNKESERLMKELDPPTADSEQREEREVSDLGINCVYKCKPISETSTECIYGSCTVLRARRGPISACPTNVTFTWQKYGCPCPPEEEFQRDTNDLN
jgi:RHS repeat-associated protein